MTIRDRNVNDGTGIIQWDPWLEPYRDKLRWRQGYFLDRLREIEETMGSLEKMADGYRYFGFNRGEDKGKQGVWYREWAPEALGLFLIGEFNEWNRTKNPMVKDEYGVWSIFLPDEEYEAKFKHGGWVKVHVVGKHNENDRIPAYIERVEWDEESHGYVGVYWNPLEYEWKNRIPDFPTSLRIYEAHVGMAQDEEKIGSFKEFADEVLPRIKKLGYNTVQLMAIQHHPYYASFGYQVSSFFAVSSYFGMPEELKELIDRAHGMGMLVLLDVIHSHSVKNIDDGLNQFDGSDYQYFHAGGKGEHPSWDTKLFNYGKFEVLRFLLSNCAYWVREFKFDGFRFDGATSMIYWDHGLSRAFDHYDRYFDDNVDEDALVYLKLVNELVHDLNPNMVTIAEEVSGMPGLARLVEEGGVGFDYRLAMGIPDNWIKWLKERSDESWHMEQMFNFLRNRRYKEKHVAYAESHDQALVGDKTLAFWLMDKEMYWHMNEEDQHVVIDRGMALHKMLRLVTFGLGGEAYLNFMGNEFGHPEWIDFPRKGNGNSFKYAKRQWSLVDNPKLKFKLLNAFDGAMQKLDETFKILGDELIELLHRHEDDKVLVFRRGQLVFVFNFHPNKSYCDFRIGVPDKNDYLVVLSSDLKAYGGFGRVIEGVVYPVQEKPWHDRQQSVQIYLPARTAQVLCPVEIE